VDVGATDMMDLIYKGSAFDTVDLEVIAFKAMRRRDQGLCICYTVRALLHGNRYNALGWQ